VENTLLVLYYYERKNGLSKRRGCIVRVTKSSGLVECDHFCAKADNHDVAKFYVGILYPIYYYIVLLYRYRGRGGPTKYILYF